MISVSANWLSLFELLSVSQKTNSAQEIFLLEIALSCAHHPGHGIPASGWCSTAKAI